MSRQICPSSVVLSSLKLLPVSYKINIKIKIVKHRAVDDLTNLCNDTTLKPISDPQISSANPKSANLRTKIFF
jgi:hypothetical protein